MPIGPLTSPPRSSKEREAALPPGLLPIMVTHFTTAEEVDVESLRAVTRWAVEAGVAGLVPLGIMGEAHKLSDRERDLVLKTVVEEAGAFFFSSRRRHTRFDCDWSSDVCSSD